MEGLSIDGEFELHVAAGLSDADAFLSAEDARFDAVILGLEMPDGVGHDYCAKLRRLGHKMPIIIVRWLRVSGTAKMPQIDQSVRHQLHTVVALLVELKAQQKPFEFVLPGEGPLHAEP